MTQKMNVKIPTAKLIKALEAALAQRIKDVEQYKTDRLKFDKDLEAFNRSLVSLIGTKKLTLKDTTVRNAWRAEGRMVTFDFALIDEKIKEPEAPNFPHRAENEISEIKNAIAILKLTDDETVSTSTYNNVSRFL
jgi:hypothetical protein